MFGEKISFTDSAKSSKKEDQFTEYCKKLKCGKIIKEWRSVTESCTVTTVGIAKFSNQEDQSLNPTSTRFYLTEYYMVIVHGGWSPEDKAIYIQLYIYSMYNIHIYTV